MTNSEKAMPDTAVRAAFAPLTLYGQEIAEIVEELEVIEEEASRTCAAWRKVLERVGARTALSARIQNFSQRAGKVVRALVPRAP